MPNPFQKTLIGELKQFLDHQQNRFPPGEVLKMDLHCHDHYSRIPDELLGRILNVPETWLKTEDLINTLGRHKCMPVTITNHNNAQACYELREKGMDILTGAEFSCRVPDFGIGIHVLAYGFSPSQEEELQKRRESVYRFQEYALEENIPTIWAHPLFYYSPKGMPPFLFFQKMALVFERFEVLNGQRDTRQNMLVKHWVERLTPAIILDYAKQTGIPPDRYCSNPFRKTMAGGSDSHFGIFAGLTGSRLYVPDLQERLGEKAPSELALEAIRKGLMAPYGSHNNSEKLTISFLEYVCQLAKYYRDPGLLRILLHKGSLKDKAIALFVSNGLAELQHHKVTMKFIEIFHDALKGKAPSFSKRWFVPKNYRTVFSHVNHLATIERHKPVRLAANIHHQIMEINRELNQMLSERLARKRHSTDLDKFLQSCEPGKFLDQFEIPSVFRNYGISNGKNHPEKKQKRISYPDLPAFLDGLSFPFLASTLILAASFISARVMYHARPLMKAFSDRLQVLQQPAKTLWLLNSFKDFSQATRILNRAEDHFGEQPIEVDFLICHSTCLTGTRVQTIKPLLEIPNPIEKDAKLFVPDMMEVHDLFFKGAYDRIVCPADSLMGLIAMYLKNAYCVPLYGLVSENQYDYAARQLNLNHSNLTRLKRLLRAYYHTFDGLFVNNPSIKTWLTGEKIDMPENQVFAHDVLPEYLAPDKPTTIPETNLYASA